MAVQVVEMIFPLITILCVALNATSLVILCRTINLKKVRFHCLVLYLSISDTLMGLYILIIIINYRFVATNDRTSIYICTFFGSLTRATSIFSMYQVLLICLERLNATYNATNSCLKKMTSDLAVAVGFVVLHAYPLVFWIYESQMTEPTCAIMPTTVQLISLDIPAILLTSATVVLYCLIIRRIISHHKKIQSTTQQGQQYSISTSNRVINMRRNVMTLGIIVVCSALIVSPRSIASVTSLIMGRQFALVLSVSTYMMVLNPVIDPIIYVLRIKRFRKRIKCYCCVASTNIELDSTIPTASTATSRHVRVHTMCLTTESRSKMEP